MQYKLMHCKPWDQYIEKDRYCWTPGLGLLQRRPQSQGHKMVNTKKVISGVLKEPFTSVLRAVSSRSKNYLCACLTACQSDALSVTTLCCTFLKTWHFQTARSPSQRPKIGQYKDNRGTRWFSTTQAAYGVRAFDQCSESSSSYMSFSACLAYLPTCLSDVNQVFPLLKMTCSKHDVNICQAKTF